MTAKTEGKTTCNTNPVVGIGCDIVSSFKMPGEEERCLNEVLTVILIMEVEQCFGTTEKGHFDQGPRLYNFWMLANMCTGEKDRLKQEERHRISIVTVL